MAYELSVGLRAVAGWRGVTGPGLGDKVGTMTIRRPRPLQRGDWVGLFCPAGAPLEAGRIDAGRKVLEARGYRVKEGPNARSRHGGFAGTDAQRLSDLNGLLADPEVRMLMAVRGGYGCGRLLDGIDVAAVHRDPKWVVGYSDVTALQMSLLARTGLVSVSGPMAGVELARGMDGFTEASLWSLLEGETRGLPLGNPEGEPWEVVVPGVAEGRLMGGCLSLVASLMGSGHLPSMDGALLVLEDIHESLHRLDRMLVHLRLAGVLGRVSAVVLGQFTHCGPADPRGGWLEWGQIVREVLGGLGVPVVMRHAYGHEARKRSLPWGLRARLDAREGGGLTLME